MTPRRDVTGMMVRIEYLSQIDIFKLFSSELLSI